MLRATHLLLTALLLLSPSAVAQPSSADTMVEMLTTIDDRQKNSGDYKALIYMEQTERGKETLGYQMVAYRRDRRGQAHAPLLEAQIRSREGIPAARSEPLHVRSHHR